MATQTSLFFFISFLSFQHLLLAAMAKTNVKAGYWFPESDLAVADIDSTLFTHLFCSFADLDSATNQVTISSSKAAAFSSFTATVRRKNPAVTTLLSIGGGSANLSNFATMASQPSSRKAFIDSTITTARSNNFFGLDLDWEYPQTKADMANLGALFREWRAAIDSESKRTCKRPLLLTAAVSVSPNVGSVRYPIRSVRASVDWLNIMAYDFYAPGRTSVTSAHAALYDPAGGISGSSGVSGWISAGLPGRMMVFGLPYYGYAWKLADPANNGLGAPATGAASGTGIGGDGSIAYNQIRAFIQGNNAKTVYDSSVVVNYCYSGTTWIGYDDLDAVAGKVSFAKKKGLAGYFAWSVGGDNNWALSRRASSTRG